MEFKVGDRVIALENTLGFIPVGRIGSINEVIACGHNGKPSYRVTWDDITGISTPSIHMNQHELRLLDAELSVGVNKVEVVKNMVKKVSNMMKKLLDTDTQDLVKAGYVNGDLELTTEGKTAILEILFDAHKAALVESARVAIKETEKENKD